MENSYVIGDDVWNRVVQIVQEAMLMGVDCADLLRQVRVNVTGDVLSLTPEYRKMITEHHDKLLTELNEKRAAETQTKIIGG
jgi:hypothetical protein